MQYELFYLVGQRQESNLDAIREAVKIMLVSEGAKLLEPELTEKRKLSYEIKHQNKGTYVTRRFELEDIDFWADEKNGDKEFGIQAMTNKLNLNNDVLRFLIVKTEDLPAPGAKERRKAQEMKTQRPENARSGRPERKEAPRQFVKPAPTVTAPIAPRQVVETPKETVSAPKVEKAETPKEATQDIDKQLDDLLNI